MRFILFKMFICFIHFYLFVSVQLNRQEFEDVDDEVRVQYEGFRPGMYVRVEIPALPCEFVINFDPHYPIILGGLGPSEGNVGYLQASLKGFILLSRSVYFTSCVVDNIVNKVKGTCFNSKLKCHYKAGVGKNIQVLFLSPQHRCV